MDYCQVSAYSEIHIISAGFQKDEVRFFKEKGVVQLFMSGTLLFADLLK